MARILGLVAFFWLIAIVHDLLAVDGIIRLVVSQLR